MMASRNILTFVVYTALIVAPMTVTALIDCSQTYCGPERAYEDLRCKPKSHFIINKDCCPKWYDCDHLYNRSSKHCYVNRNVYQIGEMLRPKDTNVCDVGCFCRMDTDGVARVKCSNVEKCLAPGDNTDLYRQHSPVDCCGGLILPKEMRDPYHNCTIDGHTYYDGDSFEIKNEPELDCVCQRKDKVTKERPMCVKHNRYLTIPEKVYTLLGSRKCAPVFDINDNVQTKTLPHDVRCKDENDYVIRSPKTVVEISKRIHTLHCVYDALILNVGDKIGSTGEAMDGYECVCELPPFVTCRTNKTKK